MTNINKIERYLYIIFRKFNSFLLIEMAVIIFGEVISRYIFRNSHGWVDEALRYSLVWMTFISLFLVAREDGHLRIKIFYNSFSTKWKFRFHLIGEIITIIQCVIFVVLGIIYCIKFWYDVTPVLIFLRNSLYVRTYRLFFIKFSTNY
jgi:TRAP-type C4-dicarboxylate transport system permease small subunit